jgi:hypothetical protein
MHGANLMTDVLDTLAEAHEALCDHPLGPLVAQLVEHVLYLDGAVDGLRRKVFPPDHEQVWVEHPEHGPIEVDARMGRLLVALWGHGIDTLHSCQGDATGYAYVMLTTREGADRFLALAEPDRVAEGARELDTDTLDGRTWLVTERDPRGAALDGYTQATSVHFPAVELRRVTAEVGDD